MFLNNFAHHVIVSFTIYLPTLLGSMDALEAKLVHFRGSVHGQHQ